MSCKIELNFHEQIRLKLVCWYAVNPSVTFHEWKFNIFIELWSKVSVTINLHLAILFALTMIWGIYTMIWINILWIFRSPQPLTISWLENQKEIINKADKSFFSFAFSMTSILEQKWVNSFSIEIETLLFEI